MLTHAADLARRFESLAKLGPDHLYHAYICPAGWPTIGWGHVVTALTVPPISRAEADVIFEADLEQARAGALRYCPALEGQRLEAITDFVFNLGAGRLKASTLRHCLNDEDWDEARIQLKRWVWGGGRKLPGLVARRDAEGALL